MVDRVFVGNHNGTFKMRVSKPGFDAKTAATNNLSIHEGLRPLIPVVTGTVSVPGGSVGDPGVRTVSVGIGFSFPPKLVLRNNLNTLPSNNGYNASLDMPNGILRIENRTASAMVVRYTIYNPI